MQTVKNITSIDEEKRIWDKDHFSGKISIKYFLNLSDTIGLDPEYSYDVNYHPNAPNNRWHSLPTFVTEFYNCSVHSLPLLVTEDQHLITEHVWPLLHKYKIKPQKTHGLWDSWGEEINIKLPPVTKQFDDSHKFVWLPVDRESANNPWHVWIDVISKFRLIERRGTTHFTKYVYIMSNPSKYFDKVAKELFPTLKYYVMPKNAVWRFKHLFVPSMSNHNDGVITPPLAPWLRHFKDLFGFKDLKPHRKIIIPRTGAKTRKLINVDELVLALKGWETVALENMTIKEQFKTFSEATHILAAHGAGLANTLWCQQGTKVIEIQDPTMLHKKVYPLLSHHLGLKHEIYLADAIPIGTTDGKKPKGVKRLNDLINFKVNITDLLKHLD